MGRKQAYMKKIMSHICYHSTIIFSFSWAVQNETANRNSSKISGSLDWNRTKSSNYTLNKNNYDINNYTLDRNISVSPVPPNALNYTASYNIVNNFSESYSLVGSTSSIINLLSPSAEPTLSANTDVASTATEPIINDDNRVKLDYITVKLTSELSSKMVVNISGSTYSCVTIENGGSYYFASDDFLASETFIDDENGTDIFYYDVQDIQSTIAPSTILGGKYSQTSSGPNILSSKPAHFEDAIYPSNTINRTIHGTPNPHDTPGNEGLTNSTFKNGIISPSGYLYENSTPNPVKTEPLPSEMVTYTILAIQNSKNIISVESETLSMAIKLTPSVGVMDHHSNENAAATFNATTHTVNDALPVTETKIQQSEILPTKMVASDGGNFLNPFLDKSVAIPFSDKIKPSPASVEIKHTPEYLDKDFKFGFEGNMDKVKPNYMVQIDNVQSTSTSSPLQDRTEFQYSIPHSTQHIYKCTKANNSHVIISTDLKNQREDPAVSKKALTGREKATIVATLVISFGLALFLFLGMCCVLSGRREITIPGAFGRIRYLLMGRIAQEEVDIVPMDGIPGRVQFLRSVSKDDTQV